MPSTMRARPSRNRRPARLAELPAPRHNPGNLLGFHYVPEGVEGPVPLVVVLHGCTQNAEAYDRGSGWSRLADRHGFALLYPEQQRANNPMLCFNWFSAADTERGKGEAASIRSMVETMAGLHDVDPARIFVTGLSAGGAMTSVMLATYPETFAAGAIIAGIAYGCASDASQAFDCMGGRAAIAESEPGARVRRASAHKGPWPRVSVWQGGADRTVVPGNADSIVRQWVDVHGLEPGPSRVETVDSYPRRVWEGEGGVPLIEHYEIVGMAHGTPLDPGAGEGRSGEAGAHMIDAAISSTDRIAAFFGIAPEPPARRNERTSPAPPSGRPTRPPPARRRSAPTGANGIQATIEKALRAAGLLR